MSRVSDPDIAREIQDSKNDDHARQIADKVHHTLTRLFSDGGNQDQRWIWELLQNARDSMHGSDEKLRVQIVVRENTLEFKHNGNPFSIKQLSSLVKHISSKESDDISDSSSKDNSPIGQFGSGFISTLALSRKVKISGILQIRNHSKYKKFTIEIDRNYNSKPELKECIKKSLNSIDDLEYLSDEHQVDDFVINSGFDTSFVYELNDESKRAVKVGAKDLERCLLFVLPLAPEIESIKLIDDEIGISNICSSVKHIDIDGVEIFKISNISSQNTIERFVISCFSSDRATAIMAETEVANSEGNELILKRKDNNTPGLFCLLPLIGSENFYFPAVINSKKFSPDESRSVANVNANALESDRDINRKVFVEALLLYEKLLKTASLNFSKSYNLLINSGVGKNIDPWHKINIQSQLINLALSTSVILLRSKAKCSIRDEVIWPYHEEKEKLEKIIYLTDQLPFKNFPVSDKEQILDLNEVFKHYDWKSFKLEPRFTLNNLAQFIASKLNIQEFSKLFQGSSDHSLSLNWLKETIPFLILNKVDSSI